MAKAVTNNLQTAITTLLAELGEDITRDGLSETPSRFEKQIRECLVGYQQQPETFVKLFDNSNNFHDLIVVLNISVSSLCEHHLLPFYGRIDIGYVPDKSILGLSKFARISDAFAKRLQTQEHLTQQIADFLSLHIKPRFLIVRMQANHSCMTVRGVLQPESITKTIAVIGDAQKYQRQLEDFRQSGNS